MGPELRADKELIDRVLVVLNHFDLEGMGPGEADGAPFDEYGNEARPIASILRRNGSISPRDLDSVWTKWFGPHLDALSLGLIEEVIAALNLAFKCEVESPSAGNET